MSSESWQEVMSSTSSTHSATDDDHQRDDSNSTNNKSSSTMPELIVSDANVDGDIAGDGVLYTLGGGLMLMFVIGTWMLGVSELRRKRFCRDYGLLGHYDALLYYCAGSIILRLI